MSALAPQVFLDAAPGALHCPANLVDEGQLWMPINGVLVNAQHLRCIDHFQAVFGIESQAFRSCGLNVETMDTTFKSAKSPHNIHFVKCIDCHTKGIPKKKATGAPARVG